ncbi:MAG: hypothetical protein JSW50_10825 [Candidatus Latescibacterota bacterium]|nr:MAG: hypothetical protein JSW50_10825 [Candidatus Latescibacterota bacterium]
MTTGFVKYITALFFAVLVMTLVAGLAYETQKVWKFGWVACVLLLLGILLVLLGFGDSKSMEHNLQRCIARFHARKSPRRAKDRPIYGDPDDPGYFESDDRPLPACLTHRVAVYTHLRRRRDPDGLQGDVAKSSSFNALIRREIRAGRL